MSTNRNRAEEAVKKGAALLDSKKKNWALRVCVPELNMDDGERCILGYVYGPDAEARATYDGDCGYAVGMERLFPKRETDSLGGKYRTADYARNKEFGFGGSASTRRFWVIEIGRRLAALAR